MINYQFFSTTFSDAVSDTAPDTPFSIAGANPVSINDLIVVSDVKIHIQRNADATVDTSPMIPANTPVKVSIYGNESISYITDTGADDGTIWVTTL
jgi:hypothetical protein